MPRLDDETAAQVDAAETRRPVLIRRRADWLTEIRAMSGELPESCGELPWADLADVLDEPDDDRWIIQRIMRQGQHMTLAAMYGSFKSVIVADLVVSVATGGRWLGAFPCGQGRVVVFAAEGGRNRYRRLIRAISRAKGVKIEPGQVITVFRAPRLKEGKMELIAKMLLAAQPELVIIDPMYLAQAGNNGRNLGEMGEMLAMAEHMCTDAGATLVAVTHFKKTGNGGSDAGQITGVGYQEWSRVVATLQVTWRKQAVRGRRKEQRAWLALEFFKDAAGLFKVEIGLDEDDQDDPRAALHYRASTWEGDLEPQAATDRRAGADAKLLDAVARLGPEVTAKVMADDLGTPVRRVQERLKALADAGEPGLTRRSAPGNRQLWTYADSEAGRE
jgi:AAA domain